MQDGPEISASHQSFSRPSLEPVAVRDWPFGWRPWCACGHHQPRPALYLGRIARDGPFLARVSAHGEGPAAGATVRAVPARPCARPWRPCAGVPRGPGGPGLVAVDEVAKRGSDGRIETTFQASGGAQISGAPNGSVGS